MGIHCPQIDGADHIGIDEGEGGAVVFKKRSRFFQAAARIEQVGAFVRNINAEMRVLAAVLLRKRHYLLAEMVHIDKHLADALTLHILQTMPQQRLAQKRN